MIGEKEASERKDRNTYIVRKGEWQVIHNGEWIAKVNNRISKDMKKRGVS